MQHAMSGGEERRGLFVVLALALAGGFAIALRNQLALQTTPASLVSIVAPWIALTFFLGLHRETYGREGRYLDFWSISHFGAGIVAWSIGLGIGWSLALAIAWELVEIVSRVHEHPTNRVVDTLLALGGWFLADAIG